MGVLKDILETIRDFNLPTTVRDQIKERKYSSISKRSLEGTLQFPVIVSRALDIDTAQMASKALERQFATFVQIVVTMDPKLNIAKDMDAATFLRRFHQNSGTKTDLRDIMHTGANLLEFYVMHESEEGFRAYATALCEGSSSAVIRDNKEQLVDVMEHLRSDILNDKFVPRNNVTYNFPNQNLSSYYNDISMVTEAPSADALRVARDRLVSAGMTNPTNSEIYKAAKDAEDDRVNSSDRRLRNTLAVRKQDLDERKFAKDNKGDYAIPSNILKDNDVRKANELVPTTLHVRALLFDEKNTQQGTMDFIIGVKSTLHPVQSDEMVSNLVGACKNNSKIFSFLRWTTGEISFVKDFMLGISEIKDDVFKRSSGASAWWITLKRRRALAKIKNMTFVPGQILPNATIVVSMDEVEQIKSEYGFNLMDSNFAYKVMGQYFLLSFVVVDNSAQIAHFLFDGQSAYQTITFGALEKENTNKADIKEVMKIINRSNMV